ncbi:MAG: helix-turn-helix transcriptional regulator [Deltaproteobacteria bacterium]|nr:helix-turn-helix transcriptional regulator [Deltaproteobacteria bacterium]
MIEDFNDRQSAASAGVPGSSDSDVKLPEQKKYQNNLREIRIENMMSKAELARKAGLSVLTITRIENGYGCRMDTKRKILKALGLKITERRKVFKDD